LRGRNPPFIFIPLFNKATGILLYMNIFEQEKKKEFETIGFKNQQKSLSVSKQVGGSNFKVDEKRRALLPGKRVSKSGKIYWETRRNRSDSSGSKV